MPKAGKDPLKRTTAEETTQVFPKSMESSVVVQLFNEAPLQGMCLSTYVGNEYSTTESRLKALVEYEMVKWIDVNHAKRT